MCGIFGIVYQNASTVPDAALLQETLGLLEHRGPDSCGVHSEVGIGLAHTRLSLVDLGERSSQPFWDAERRFCLIYNGEIYNFKELRQELEMQGVPFGTTGDTEVLLKSLIVHGVDSTLHKLEGMFAFALYDVEERTLVLARDRFGIKPLSVYQDGDVFLFSSEIKAMRPWIRLEPESFPIISYLMGFGGPMKDTSFYEGVKILPPGSIVRLRIGEQPRFDRFIRLTDMLNPDEAQELGGLDRKQVVDRMDELLNRSVERMLFADAPVGAFCSGGVDSSIIMSIAARHHNNLAIFHANVKGPQGEYDAALELSRHLGLDLKAVEVEDRDFIDLIPEVTYHYEYPFEYHPNSVPFLMVSKLVREHGVKGVLSGEGADECFLGYDFLAQEPFEGFYRHQLARLRKLVRRIPKLGRRLWPYEGNGSELIKGSLNEFERELEEEQHREAYAAAFPSESKRNVRTLDLLTYHLRTLLHRNDGLGMAASVESRFPYLDERLVRTAINLPYENKIRFSPTAWSWAHPFLREKWVLRKVADRYLPATFSRRRKRAFHMTTLDRLNVPASYFEDSFVSDFLALSGRRLEYLIENADQVLRIQLLLLDVWGRICLQNATRAEMTAKLWKHLWRSP